MAGFHRANLNTMRTLCSVLLLGILAAQFLRPISVEAESDQPKDFRYVHLWVSADGETHIKHAKMTGFKYAVYAALPQYLRSNFGGRATNITFTELPVGLAQDLHSPPSVQFVITLAGSWYIKTTDGAEYEFKPGEVLFQDNTKDTPAQKVGQHYSGTVGDVPCQQLVVWISRPPAVDDPDPF